MSSTMSPDPRGSSVLPPDRNAEARKLAASLTNQQIHDLAVQFTLDDQSGRRPFFGYPPEKPLIFIKFQLESYREILGEADMQRLAFDFLRSAPNQQQQDDPAAIEVRVPEVFKAFRIDTQWSTTLSYLVMEYVKGRTLWDIRGSYGQPEYESTSPYCSAMARTVQLLTTMPVPADAIPGPYTTTQPCLRPIRHVFFKEGDACREYKNIPEFEAHLKEIGARCIGRPGRITLERELHFCYTDFNFTNFIVHKEKSSGRKILYILDFEHASFLPLSFLAFAAHVGVDGSSAVQKQFGDTLPTDNIKAMRQIAYNLAVSGVGFGD